MPLPDWFKRLRHEDASVKPRTFAAVLLVIVLAVTTYLLIGDVAFHRAVSPLASPRRMRTMLQTAPPPTISEVSAWMTFEYLNRVFKLPPDTLKSALGITDPRYPRLSIHRWAVASGQDEALALERVKQAIRAAQSR
jgi:hypothetical protein